MPVLPQELTALMWLVLGLGLRHGLDADHLATIDALVRLRRQDRSRLAPWCGLLFSVGHSLIVLVTAGLVSVAALHWEPPRPLLLLAEWVSVCILIALGLVNLVRVFGAGPGKEVPIVGWRSRWFPLGRTAHPLAIAAIGALFALSFDTVSQASLFALAGVSHGGWATALGIGAAFSIGMILVDSLDGWWVARLVGRADQRAVQASRIATSLVATASLGIGLLGVARLTFPAVDEWSGHREAAFSIAVIALVCGGCALVGRKLRNPVG